MIELGRVQELMVVREKNFGVYLGQKKDDAAAVLLPKKQVPEGTKVGDKLKVFIYTAHGSESDRNSGLPLPRTRPDFH